MVARVLALLAALLLVSVTAVADVDKYGGGGGGGTSGGNASAREACSDGTVLGFGLNAVTGLYQETCGNYKWSAVFGGVDGNGVGDYATATTTGGNGEKVTCSAAATGESDRHGAVTPTACKAAGTVVMFNAMADLMLAQDHTVPGGIVYLPEFIDGLPAAYHFAGCGQQLDGSTANNCPVLKAPNNRHEQRSAQAIKGIHIVGGGTDWGRMQRASTEPHVGTYVLNDGGCDVSASCVPTNGQDRNGDAVTVYLNNIESGLREGATPCVPHTDGTCIAQTSQVAVRASKYGSTTTVLTATTNEANICLDNRLATTGVCEEKPTIRCTSDPNCDFTGGGGLDYGTCLGWASKLEDALTDGEIEAALVYVRNPLCDGLDEDSCAGVAGAYSTPVMIREPRLTNCDGTNGRNFAFGPVLAGDRVWPLEMSSVPVGTEVVLIDETMIGPRGGGWENLSIMHNDYLTSSACAVGTEAACDRGTLAKLRLGWWQGYRNVSFHECSREVNSCVDGGGWPAVLEDFLFNRFHVGVWSDVAYPYYRNGVIWNSSTASSGINVFSGRAFLDNIEFTSVQCGSGCVSTGRSRSVVMDRFRFHNVRGPLGMLRISRSGLVSASGWTFDGVEGSAVTIDPTDAEEHSVVTLTDFKAIGQGAIEDSASSGKAMVVFTPFTDATPGTYRKVVIDDFYLQTHEDEACLFFFDVNEQTLEDSFNRVVLKNSNVDGLGGANVEVVCASDFTANGGLDDRADSNTFGGIFAADRYPVMVNLSTNGVSRPDWPYSTITAAANQTDRYDCDLLPQGSVVAIHDATAVGACAEVDGPGAGAGQGILDGAGTNGTMAVCVCDGAGTWTPQN